MELRHLQSFLTLAKQMNFGRAAKKIKISQPALSQQIKRLEEELGAKLIIRDRARTRLTEAGIELREQARRIIQDVEIAKSAVLAVRGKRRGLLRIAHSPSHSEPVGTAIGMLLADAPELRVAAEELGSRAIEERLLDGALDIGVVRAWTPKDGIAFEELTPVPLMLIVSPQHALAKRKGIDAIEELASSRFVLSRRGTRTRRTVDAYFESMDFLPRVTAEANANGTLLSIVAALPTGVTVLPVPAPHAVHPRGLPLLTLPNPLTQSTCVLWRTPEMPSDAMRAFRDTLRAHLTGRAPETTVLPKAPPLPSRKKAAPGAQEEQGTPDREEGEG